MSDDITKTITHLGELNTTRTFNVDNRIDVALQTDVANDAEVTTITDLVLGGKAPSSVSIISGNDESPAIFSVSLVANEAVVKVADNTNVTAETINLVVRVVYDVTSVDFPVRITITAP
jgi:hypothetical protein